MDEDERLNADLAMTERSETDQPVGHWVYPTPLIRKIARKGFLVLAVLTFALLFQGSRGLWERDEGRYTGIAIQMMDSRSYLVPAFNDEFFHLSKPPFTYWAIAGGMHVLGRNEWGARLPNALAFAATIFVVLALARRITPDRSWLPPLIYGTSLLPFVGAQIVTTDTLLTLWEALAVLGFVEWAHGDGDHRPRWPILLMWTAFGLAFLTKGPPGLLPLLAIIVFTALHRGWRAVGRLFHPVGLTAFLLVGFSWYAVVVLVRPGTLGYWLHDEVVGRVASGLHHRNPQWYKAFVIYLPVLFFGCLPWLLPFLRGLRCGLPLSRTAWKERLVQDPWSIFLILWFLLPLSVFFLSSSRLPLYVLPLTLPLCLALGRWVELPLRRRFEVPLLAVWMVALLALRLGGAWLSSPMDSRRLAREIVAVCPAPRELLFVDTEPFWGLRLYLGCEVERVDTSPAVGTRVGSSEPLEEELKDAEPGTLMIVERKQAARVQERCRKLGHELRPAGGNAAWIFLWLP